MSHPRFDDLGLPQPDIDLEVGLRNCDRRMPEVIKRVLTGTGGLLGDNHALGGPCSTMRDPTERPITVEQGTNTLVPRDATTVLRRVDEILTSGGKRGRAPELWDGRAAGRIASHLAGWLAIRPASAELAA